MATVVDFEAKQGETFEITAFLVGADGLAQDLTVITDVQLNMRSKDDPTVVVIDNAVMVVEDAVTGKVSYSSPAVVDYAVGKYELDFTVRFPGGRVRKFPTNGFKIAQIFEKVD